MVTTRLVLVRHGESEWNAQGRLQGQGGTALSALGRRQSEALAAYLERRFVHFHLVVTSDLQRAVQTAQPWLSRVPMPVRVDTRWREVDVGTWSGLTWAEVQDQDPQRYAAWRDGEDVRRGGGETFAEFRVRTAAAMETLRDTDGTVLVFTHGGSVRFAVAAALGLPPMGERTLAPVHNCSVTEIVLGPDGPSLASYNLHDHLAGVGG
ncbi:MAG: histidine phosphatase family protein [Nitriliruptorales bacterium]|nr:histidine phosphatase family protein [Nitriliruptorales bacterium]